MEHAALAHLSREDERTIRAWLASVAAMTTGAEKAEVERLKRLVRLRLNRLLQGRVSESDVVDEILHDAAQRLNDFRANPPLTLFVWLRRLACEKLLEVHRRHLGVDDPVFAAPGELTLHAGALPIADSVSLAAIQSAASSGVQAGPEKCSKVASRLEPTAS